MSKNRIWITGAEGHIGYALRKLLPQNGYNLLCTDYKDVDVTDAEAVRVYADMNRPDVIINCAALTDPKECAADPERAYKLNAIGARNVAAAAQRINAEIIQISTDDVFDGNSQVPYNEFDTPIPRSVYGKSKLAGEHMVSSLCSRHIIVRSSWVYGTGFDFVDAFMNAEGSLEVPDNESAVPTSAKELAKTIVALIEGSNYGTFHIVCTGGGVTRYEYAKMLKKITGKDIELIPVKSNGEARPVYSVLDNMMLRISNIKEPQNWIEALKQFVNESK